METHLIVPSALVVFSALYMGLSQHFEKVWGVDPSRMTPAQECDRGLSAVWMFLRDTLACLPLVVVCAHGAAALSLPAALEIIAAACCILGVLWFMALFVSVRHGACGLAELAAEEIGAPMRWLVPLLTITALMTAQGMVAFSAAWYLFDAGPDPFFSPLSRVAYAALTLVLLLTLMPVNLQAGSLRSEGEAAPLTMGSSLVLALFAVLALVQPGYAPQISLPLSEELREWLWYMLRQIICIFTMERLMYIGGQQLWMILRRKRLPHRKDDLPCRLVGVLMYMASAFLAYALRAGMISPLWLLPGAVSAAALIVIAAASFTLWFARIGRRVI